MTRSDRITSNRKTKQNSHCEQLLYFRVFPNRRRSEVETLLQKYRGDVVQAMEAMLTGDDAMPPIAVPAPSPTFPMKSAFSPLVPPGVFNPAAANRYALFQQQHQQHTKRKLCTHFCIDDLTT